jgi:hypothetical protein
MYLLTAKSPGTINTRTGSAQILMDEEGQQYSIARFNHFGKFISVEVFNFERECEDIIFDEGLVQ